MHVSLEFDKYRQLNGGIPIEELEQHIQTLLELLMEKGTNWMQGIELINDLMYLKKHDFSEFSQNISLKIFNWIKDNYNGDSLKDMNALSEEDADRQFYLVSALLDTLRLLRNEVNTIQFLKMRLTNSTNEFEQFEIEDFIGAHESTPITPKPQMSQDELLQIEEKANKYLQEPSHYHSDVLACLIETITEHKHCYTLGWCLESERYTAKPKRARFAGGGPLLVSKHTDHIQMVGSGQIGNDYIGDFEELIQGIVSYQELKIEFDKTKIAPLKSFLNCSSSELLKKIKQDGYIYIEEPEYRQVKEMETLKNEGINCFIETKIRKR